MASDNQEQALIRIICRKDNTVRLEIPCKGMQPEPPFDLNLDKVRKKLISIFFLWLINNKITAENESQLLGGVLYDAVKINSLNCDLTQEQNLRFQLEFEETDADLDSYPWELMTDSDNGGELFSSKYPFSRFILAKGEGDLGKTPQRPEKLPPEKTEVRILYTSFLTEEEKKKIDDAESGKAYKSNSKKVSLVDILEGIKASTVAGLNRKDNNFLSQFDPNDRNVIIHSSPNKPNPPVVPKNLGEFPVKIIEVIKPSLLEDNLPQYITRYQPHIIHIIGYGKFAPTVDSEQECNHYCIDGVWHTAKQFDGLLSALKNSPPRLLVFHFCQHPAEFRKVNLRKLAGTLKKHKIYSFIALYYSIDLPSAIKFINAFYLNLGQGKSVDVAVKESRQEILPNTPWVAASPVLYMHRQEARIFPSDADLQISGTSAGAITGNLPDTPPAGGLESKGGSFQVQWLAPEEILAIHKTSVANNLIGKRDLLLGGMYQNYKEGLKNQTSSPSDQLLSDLQSLNVTPETADGKLPLEIWLTNAAYFTSSFLNIESFFKEFTAKVAQKRQSK